MSENHKQHPLGGPAYIDEKGYVQFDLQVELNSTLQHDMMRLEVKYENLKNERDGLLYNKHQMQMKHSHLSRRNELLEQKLKEITAICQRDITPAVYDDPWVKTADRMPTEADADRKLDVFVWTHSGGHVVNYQRVIDSPDFYPYWMPIPPLPEVEE